jgi:hypothetical protein
LRALGEDAVNLRRTDEELDEINDKIRIRPSDGTRRLWARLRRWRGSWLGEVKD